MADTLFVIAIEDGRADILTASTESLVELEIVENIASIKVKGHFWEGVAAGQPAKVEATPILSGNSCCNGVTTCWGVRIPEQNAQIGYVGQTMKQVTHLVATLLFSSGYNALELGNSVAMDMSFDHMFVSITHIGD